MKNTFFHQKYSGKPHFRLYNPKIQEHYWNFGGRARRAEGEKKISLFFYLTKGSLSFLCVRC